MAFVKGIPIFTDSGWKNIEEISGHDKVLVRNFLGDAELIQPFALKKRQYDGEVIKIGAKDWAFTVTPDHIVVYDKNKYANGRHFKYENAEDFTIEHDTRIYRKFKYMFSDEPRREMIKIRDDFGTKTVSISNYDWYKLVGYVLCRGFIRKKPGRPMLFIFLDNDKKEDEIQELGDILDRIGVGWYVQHYDNASSRVVVSSKNTLVYRLMTRLGSSKRREMFLPDKMIYNSTRELAKLLVDTIINVMSKKDTKVGDYYRLSTPNKKLLDSLVMFGTLNGYSVVYSLAYKAGTPSFTGVTKVDGYVAKIGNPTATYVPQFKNREYYNGPVYEIDLFDGQVYVKERSMPVWVNPK